jgi:hypothetical protein
MSATCYWRSSVPGGLTPPILRRAAGVSTIQATSFGSRLARRWPGTFLLCLCCSTARRCLTLSCYPTT